MRMVRLFLKFSHDFIWSQLYKTLDQFSIKLSKSNVLQHFVNIKIYFFQGNERLYNKLIINYFLQLNVKFVDHLTGFFFTASAIIKDESEAADLGFSCELIWRLSFCGVFNFCTNILRKEQWTQIIYLSRNIWTERWSVNNETEAVLIFVHRTKAFEISIILQLSEYNSGALNTLCSTEANQKSSSFLIFFSPESQHFAMQTVMIFKTSSSNCPVDLYPAVIPLLYSMITRDNRSLYR